MGEVAVPLVIQLAKVTEVRAERGGNHVADRGGRVDSKLVGDVEFLHRGDVGLQPLKDIQSGSFVTLVVSRGQIRGHDPDRGVALAVKLKWDQ